MTTPLHKGERVIVTNLRTGTQHPGEVVKEAQNEYPYLNVRYDTGETVRVGEGFVTREAA